MKKCVCEKSLSQLNDSCSGAPQIFDVVRVLNFEVLAMGHFGLDFLQEHKTEVF